MRPIDDRPIEGRRFSPTIFCSEGEENKADNCALKVRLGFAVGPFDTFDDLLEIANDSP
jgi:hypothetical protein